MTDDSINDRKLRVFLCHASEDRDQVLNLYQQLEAFGFDPWIDKKDLIPGQDWELIIEQEIDKTDAIIVCLSDISVAKTGYVQREIRIALKKADYFLDDDCYLVPLKLNECAVPFKLRRFHYVDLFSISGFEMLIKALNYRAAKLAIITCKFNDYSNVTPEILMKMINNSNTGISVTLFRKICKDISAGTIAIEVLLNFVNHPYWLIRKLAIEEIINSHVPNTLDLLYEFKDVSYHVSQALIRNYIEKRLNEKSFSPVDIEVVIDILNHMSTAEKASEISRKKDNILLEDIKHFFKDSNMNE